MSRMSELPGYKEPTTSRDAAVAMAPRLGELQRRVLAALALQADIPDALAMRLGEDRLAIRPRFTELAAKGLIVKTGETRCNGSSGRKAAVWKVAP